MKGLFTYLLLLMVFAAKGQDIHFSQFAETPQLINPALTGVFRGNVRVIANYRDQWASVDSPYRTFGFNYDQRIEPKRWKNASLAFGVAAFRDDAGDLGLNTTSGVISLASTIKLTYEQSVTAGIQSGILYRGIDMTNAVWGNQFDGANFDPTQASGELADFNSFVSPDVSLGFSWNLDAPRGMGAFRELWIEAGTGLFHVNRPQQKFNLSAEPEQLNMKWTLHAKAVMGVGSGKSFIVPLLFVQVQGPSTDVVFGGLYRFLLKETARVTGFVKGGALSLGATYRWGDAITPTINFEFSQFTIGVSYDINVSGLTQATAYQGGLEISLRFIAAEGFYFAGRKSRN